MNDLLSGPNCYSLWHPILPFLFFTAFRIQIGDQICEMSQLKSKSIILQYTRQRRMGNTTSQKQKKIKNVLPQTAEEKKEMKKPHIVKPCPEILRLEVGKQYEYCACGLSKSQPFCDGSHEGTKFTPIKFTATQSLNILCLCKRSKNGPFCDNQHKKYFSIEF